MSLHSEVSLAALIAMGKSKGLVTAIRGHGMVVAPPVAAPMPKAMDNPMDSPVATVMNRALDSPMAQAMTTPKLQQRSQQWPP